jgi:ribosomal protein S18 acetylase RimI-like enzyme
VGFAIAESFIEPNSGQQHAELLSLFVLPAYRKQGICTSLVKHLLQLFVVTFTR